MPRVLVVERDAARRDSLHFVLSQSGYEVAFVSRPEFAQQRINSIDLLIVGNDDLDVLDDLLRSDSQRMMPVLALMDAGNFPGIMKCLSARVTRILSSQREQKDVLNSVRSLIDEASSGAAVRKKNADGAPLTRDGEQHADLVKALQSACEEISSLQQKYELELAHRRKVEQALMESEAFYQSLVETLPLAMLRKDLNGRFTFANRLLCDAFNRSPEEIIGHSDHDFFPRELAEKYRSDDRHVVETRTNFETTEEFQTATGQLRYTHVVKSPVYDATGSLVGIQGIFSDVTEKVQAERELIQTKARLQEVLDAATQVAIISTDVHGSIVLFNTGAERMLGYSKEEMLGKTPEVFHLPSEVLARGAQLSREFRREIRGFNVFVEYARRGDHEEREWTYVRKDGSQIRVLLSVTAKHDHNGHVNGFLGIATDITARHLAEAELMKAKEAAEAANRAKSDFLANMSHEIRTPLNAIIGMTELVRDTELNGTQREYLGMVQEAGESLLAVINDILDFSKIEAGKLSLERIGFNLRELLGDTMKSLALRAHRKSLELACHVAAVVPTAVEGDPHRLRQVVVNLVGNAIKFTERGEVVLDVDVERATEDEIVLHFQVTDTGIGISPDQLHTIFEAFEQADTSTTRRYGGTGLGLAISSRLVELMRGSIWVESEVDRGSTFHFLVRFWNATAPVDDAETTIYPTILKGLNVLIVDDNATNRRILVEIMNNWTMNPVAVACVSDALVELRSKSEAGNPYALVLTDANMPDKDGFELARKIHENPMLCRSMVMMLTSGDRPNDLKRCKEYGVASYLIKPVKQSELLDAILAAIGDQSALSNAQDQSPGASRKSARPKSILLAEDSVINQKLAIGLLEKWGHRVTVANDGHEAVMLSGQLAFDAVLMDVQMPEMDGLDATRAIRQRELLTGQHLPILAMTAHAMKGDRERCLEAGMDDYLMKPIRAEQLFQALERIGMEKSPAPPNEIQLPKPASEKDHVDWDFASQAVNFDDELLLHVVEAFREECPQLIETMRRSIAAAEWKQYQRAAHTLKSGMRMFGVVSLANEIERLELAAKTEQSQTEIPASMNSIAHRSGLILDEMTSFAEAPPGKGEHN